MICYLVIFLTEHFWNIFFARRGEVLFDKECYTEYKQFDHNSFSMKFDLYCPLEIASYGDNWRSGTLFLAYRLGFSIAICFVSSV